MHQHQHPGLLVPVAVGGEAVAPAVAHGGGGGGVVGVVVVVGGPGGHQLPQPALARLLAMWRHNALRVRVRAVARAVQVRRALAGPVSLLVPGGRHGGARI